MDSYRWLAGWLRALSWYKDTQFEQPGDPVGPYKPDEHGYGWHDPEFASKAPYCRLGDPPFRPGIWVEPVFRPGWKAQDDLMRLAGEIPEAGRQVREALDAAEEAYQRFETARQQAPPSRSTRIAGFPANRADERWQAFDEQLGALRGRLEAAVQLIQSSTLSDASAPAGSPVETAESGAPPVGYLSSRQLAERFKVPHRRLDSRLVRWRQRNAASSEWVEHDAARKNEPRFVYQVQAVEPIIQKLRQKTGNERGTEKS